MKITRRPWGSVGGRAVWLFEMERDGLRAAVSNYGGIVQSLWVSDGSGRSLDVVLGYDTLEEYRRCDTFFGAAIGPVADRIAGGRCLLDGRWIELPRNAGPDVSHSGAGGFHRRVWDWREEADGLCLFADMDERVTGFPGTLSVELRYRLLPPRTLRLESVARCTRETAVSITNHSYFTLNGGRSDCLDHRLTLRAGRYAQTCREADPIPTGRLLPVAGTPLDFREGPSIGEAVDRFDFGEIARAGGVDHFFAVEGSGLREHAILRCPGTGLAMRCRSDAPGLLVYTANGLGTEPGKGGRIYRKRFAVCLETECLPNAVNLPRWRPQVLLAPGEVASAATEFECFWE